MGCAISPSGFPQIFSVKNRFFSMRHRLTGVHEPHKRFAPNGRLLFLHRLTGAHELPQAGSPLTGGEFFAEPQRGVALCGARESAAPAAGAKRKGHLRFPFLFELLPFLQRAWVQMVDCVSVEKGNGRGFFLPRGITPFRISAAVLLHRR